MDFSLDDITNDIVLQFGDPYGYHSGYPMGFCLGGFVLGEIFLGSGILRIDGYVHFISLSLLGMVYLFFWLLVLWNSLQVRWKLTGLEEYSTRWHLVGFWVRVMVVVIVIGSVLGIEWVLWVIYPPMLWGLYLGGSFLVLSLLWLFSYGWDMLHAYWLGVGRWWSYYGSRGDVGHRSFLHQLFVWVSGIIIFLWGIAGLALHFRYGLFI